MPTAREGVIDIEEQVIGPRYHQCAAVSLVRQLIRP